MHLTNWLKQEKRQLTSLEKLELWERLKILSFTRVVLLAWAMTMLCLYIRIQVNILGMHLYVDTARGIRSSHMLKEEAEHIDRHDQQEFLAIADYLTNYGQTTLISNIQAMATKVLNGKQLRDPFNSTTVGETIMKILDIFMGIHHWVTYLVPENVVSYK
ncbi:hypothetical protein GIB67_040434 [Kingdonia uniflora]|uniref:Uncharacterized protein n=1 Tax=Kingdonia uniflora TaxID=39325 RepID=A0A7J7KXP5_9MAGN|nr:hypothetical protein GIB67_040434 [Kingdonia uniflora]